MSSRGPAPAPELSLVLPLVHERGDVLENVRTWTHEQSLERGRFQIVVATDGSAPEVEGRISELLAPQDVVVRSTGAGYMDLYNLGVARAQADWVVLTEAHVLGDPGCLAAVRAGIEAEPELEAAQLVAGGHVRPTRFADLLAEWFESVFARWEEPGQWRRLSFFGTAIRRSAYLEAGAVNEDHGLFSPSFLSAVLDARGAGVGRFADARVFHIADNEIVEHHEHTSDFARGECVARAARDAVFCEGYFGWAPLWANRARYRPGVARPVLRALAAAAVHALVRQRRDAPWILAELARRLPAAAGGALPRLAGERLALACDQRAAMHLPLRRERERSMLRAHANVVRITQLEWTRANPGAPAPARFDGGPRPVHELDGAIAGVHALEHDGERRWRWTEPAAHLHLDLPPGDHVLSIDTGGRRGPPRDCVSGVYVGARRVRRGQLDGDGTRLFVSLPEAWRARIAREGITFLTRPRDPRRDGGEDPRRLGLPVYGIGLLAEARSRPAGEAAR